MRCLEGQKKSQKELIKQTNKEVKRKYLAE